MPRKKANAPPDPNQTILPLESPPAPKKKRGRGKDRVPRKSKYAEGKGPTKGDRKGQITLPGIKTRERIIELVANREMSYTAIAKEVGITRARLFELMQEPDVAKAVRTLVDARRERAREIILTSVADVADDAVEVALGRKKASKEQVAMMRDLLDRAGLAATRKVEVRTNDLSGKTDAELEAIIAGEEPDGRAS